VIEVVFSIVSFTEVSLKFSKLLSFKIRMAAKRVEQAVGAGGESKVKC